MFFEQKMSDLRILNVTIIAKLYTTHFYIDQTVWSIVLAINYLYT